MKKRNLTSAAADDRDPGDAILPPAPAPGGFDRWWTSVAEPIARRRLVVRIGTGHRDFDDVLYLAAERMAAGFGGFDPGISTTAWIETIVDRATVDWSRSEMTLGRRALTTSLSWDFGRDDAHLDQTRRPPAQSPDDVQDDGDPGSQVEPDDPIDPGGQVEPDVPIEPGWEEAPVVPDDVVVPPAPPRRVAPGGAWTHPRFIDGTGVLMPALSSPGIAVEDSDDVAAAVGMNRFELDCRLAAIADVEGFIRNRSRRSGHRDLLFWRMVVGEGLTYTDAGAAVGIDRHAASRLASGLRKALCDQFGGWEFAGLLLERRGPQYPVAPEPLVNTAARALSPDDDASSPRRYGQRRNPHVNRVDAYHYAVPGVARSLLTGRQGFRSVTEAPPVETRVVEAPPTMVLHGEWRRADPDAPGQVSRPGGEPEVDHDAARQILVDAVDRIGAHRSACAAEKAAWTPETGRLRAAGQRRELDWLRDEARALQGVGCPPPVDARSSARSLLVSKIKELTSKLNALPDGAPRHVKSALVDRLRVALIQLERN